MTPVASPQLFDEPGLSSRRTFDRSYEPEQRLHRDDLRRELSAELDDDERWLLKLLLDGRSLNHIGETLGISYSAAGVRVHRLRAKPRRILTEKGL